MRTAKNSDIFERIYDIVRLIPKGRVSSYGAIANYLGAKKSSRVVGWAMNASHSLPEKMPAHRVVNRNGMLTGKMHFSHPNEMEDKLKAENIQVENDKIINFNEVFWDPIKELSSF